MQCLHASSATEEHGLQYRTLGRTGVQISSLALGAMNFGKIGRTAQDEAIAVATRCRGHRAPRRRD
jgi:hypothetical protein